MKYLVLALFPLFAQANTPTDISHIYSYQCEGNFLEGEGVDPYSISCLPFQRLGFLNAKHTAYLFSSLTESNLHEKLSDSAYSSPLCGRQLSRLLCSESVPEARFGLSRRPERIFQIPIILSPSLSHYSRIYGYAASPAPDGNCPEGLVRARYFEAVPETISSPLPSSFANFRGSQNDRIIHVEGESLPEFQVLRRANLQPCDASGDCRYSLVNPPELAQSVPYNAMADKPAICVIPK